MQIRFYVHKTGKHKSALQVLVTELTPGENKTTKLYWSFMDDHGDQWMRVVLQMPNITQRQVCQLSNVEVFKCHLC